MPMYEKFVLSGVSRLRQVLTGTRSLFAFLLVLGAIAATAVLLFEIDTTVSGQQQSDETVSERKSEPEFPNFDIRNEKRNDVIDYFVAARTAQHKNASAVADIRDDFARGEAALKARVPNVKFEYNNDMRAPEVITPDVWQDGIDFLSRPSGLKRSEILRNFIKENNRLIGVTDTQATTLKVTADYTNPSGNMSFALLEQEINGIPVFRGEVKAGFTKDGEIVRVINNLAPGLDYAVLPNDFGDPLEAVRAAGAHIRHEFGTTDLSKNDSQSKSNKVVFGTGDWATTAEKMYFPTEPGVAVPAWRVLLWEDTVAYYVIVDAKSGTMLWRKNIANEQTQAATYQIYGNPNAFIDVADSPAPFSPGPVDPTLPNIQGAIIARTNRTLIGNEGPLSFNNSGWITDGANHTDGNATEAGLDVVAPNGVAAPMLGDTACPGAGCRVFTSTWNPPPGNPAPGQDPTDPQARRGAVIQMFYIMNRYHDVLYQLGWTEQAFNFQHDNFGRGGVANDRISSEAQDSSGTNNANFFTPADGQRGRMQMYRFTGPTPDYDGTTDAEIVIHEVTHGLSNRLHGNAGGLATNMSGGMGEGWGDWYAHTLLAEPTDPINGVYAAGGYATNSITAGFLANYYYGIRRYPKAVIAFTGGLNNRPHNPLSFRHLNSNCNTEIGTPTTIGTVSAFPRGPVGSTDCDQVHAAGEIWSSLLWEVRALMVTRSGFADGTQRVLQVVTDGMKLSPINPTFLQGRDAIIAAAAALPTGSGDAVVDVREGFRRRGMGFSASIQNATTAAVTEAYDLDRKSVA